MSYFQQLAFFSRAGSLCHHKLPKLEIFMVFIIHIYFNNILVRNGKVCNSGW